MPEVFPAEQVLRQQPVQALPVWLLLLALLCPLRAEAIPQWLFYTLPDSTRYEYHNADSTYVSCFAGASSAPVRSLQRAYLWRVTAQGGSVVVDSHSVIATGAVADSFPTPGPGTYYVTVRNSAGMSCASNPVAIYPDVTTGVEPEPIAATVRCSLYNVHGRLVAKVEGEECWQRVLRRQDLASGVYWVKAQGGSMRKVVILK